MNRFVLCFVCASALLALVEAANKVGHPVAFVPGIMGVLLHAKAENIPKDHVPLFCPRNHKEFPIWFNAAFDFNIKCFRHYLKMNYTAATNQWVGTQGVTVTVPKEGTMFAVDILDAETTKLAKYLHKFIVALEDHGYMDGVNMTACGYDWRKLPDQEWANKCRGYIEKMVQSTGKKAIFIGHSMGGPYSYYVLRTAPAGWVEKYIYKYITPSPAWMGAPRALDAMFSGLGHLLPSVLSDLFAPLARSIPAIWFLLPWSEAFDGIAAVKTPANTYSWREVTKILSLEGLDQADAKMKYVRDVFDSFNNYEEMPNVPMITTFATDMDTLYTLVFKEELSKQDPEGDWKHPDQLHGAGDDTVPESSLKYVTDKWMKKYPDRNITFVRLSEVDHTTIVTSDEFIKLTLDEAFNDY